MGRQIEELARFVARDAVRGHSGAGAGACQAGAARHARRDPRRQRAAGGRGAARAARGDGRNRRDGLRARLARQRSAHRGAAERHRRARDRAVRGAAARFRAGGDAGPAGGAGGRRAGGQAPGARCWRRSFSATMSSGGSPAGSRRARWRIRTGRCRCSPRRLPGRNCAGSTPPGSAARCASRRRCC